MAWGTLSRFLLWCLGAIFVVSAGPALADATPITPACHANAGRDVDYSTMLAEPQRWDCSRRDWSISDPRAFLRFDLGEASEPAKLRFSTRLTRFETMRLTLIGTDGRSASRTVGQDEMKPSTSDWMMSTGLPAFEGPAKALLVEIDAPRHPGMLSDARITPEVPADARIRLELLFAAICGILFLPLVFNLAFYRVLRERFVLWHALAVLMMLIQTLVTTGLINRFVKLPLDQICAISAFSWGFGIVAAALFSINLMEPGRLDPLQKGLIRGLALWIPAWTCFYLYADGSLRGLASPLYFASFVPVLGLFVWVMATAKLRGSRAVNFQIAAWTPIMVTGTIRMVSSLGLTDAPLEMQLAQHLSIAFEVIVASLGVADRFLVIKRQRDRAQKQSQAFAELAERDPLTGLLNRRAVEDRFDELQAAGFRTMAVIDLDHFKKVNDNHGHAKGDDVLRATADALEPDEDTLSVRLGGEEFLLLLRGRNTAARAERRRQAISTRVSAMVPGLDRMVTASMGLVEHSSGSLARADFATLYAQCDRLLYEAKGAGRNRTMSEKMRGFSGHPDLSRATA